MNVEDVASDSKVTKEQDSIFLTAMFQENTITDKQHTYRVSYAHVKAHLFNKSRSVFIIQAHDA